MICKTELTSKTGVEEELGVIPCAVDGVFDAINAVS